MHLSRRRNPRRRGGAVVELAVVTPVLMLLLLGIIQMGYIFMARQNVVLASRAGARAAAIKHGAMSDVNTAVDAAMHAAGLTGYTTTSNVASLSATDTQVWVTVTLPFSQVNFCGQFLGITSFNLTSTVTMRREGVSS